MTISSTLLALAGCGGGDDDAIGQPMTTITVSAATQSSVNGGYVAAPVRFGVIERVNALDPNFDVCRFDFAGFQQSGGAGELRGTISYQPVSPTRPALQLQSSVFVISGTQYVLQGSSGVSMDAAAGRIAYSGAVFSSSSPPASVTVSGNLPLPTHRPGGC